MAHRYAVAFLLASLAAGAAHAQGLGPGVRGGRAAALGNASATLSNDLWAAGNNIAGLATLRRAEAGVYAENRFLVPQLNSAALAVAVPLGRVPETDETTSKTPPAPPHGVVGVELQRFGGALFSETRAGVGYAYRLGIISIGARADMVQVSFQELGSRRTVAASLGGQAEVIPDKLTFGVFLYNLNQARLANYQDERLPTVLRAGLGYRASAKVLLLAETEKDIEQDADFKAGLEYQLIDALAVRAGVATLTEQVTGGFGLHVGKLRVDYAAAWHNALGLSQHLSVNLRLNAVK